MPGDPTQPIFHRLALGFRVAANANFTIRIDGNANFSVFRYQHASIPDAKFHIGDLSQRNTQRDCFRIAVEYRLLVVLLICFGFMFSVLRIDNGDFPVNSLVFTFLLIYL